MLRAPVVVACSAALAVAGLPAVAGAAPVKAHRIASGTTTLELAPAAAANLRSMGVSMTAVSPAKTALPLLKFPLKPGGVVRTRGQEVVGGAIAHRGGLQLAKGETVVTMDGLKASFGSSPAFTGRLFGALRMAVGSLDLSTATVKVTASRLTVTGVQLRLTKDAADAMNGTFDVTGFKEDDLVGRARISSTLR